MPASPVLGEPQFAPISSAVANATLVAAQGANVKIRVLGFLLVAAAAAVAKFQSGGVDITGPMSLATGVGIWIDYAPLGVFETAANALLNLNQTGTVQLSGWLVWATAS